MKLPPPMCDTLWFFISFFLIPPSLGEKKKVMGGGLIVTPPGINLNIVSPSSSSLFFSSLPLFLPGFFPFFSPSLSLSPSLPPRLAERPLERSLWPSHWQMLLWNVMKFEMGAAVTIILRQGLSLAWYHYRWQLEWAPRNREHPGRVMVRFGDRRRSHRVLWARGGGKQVVHSCRESGWLCACTILFCTSLLNSGVFLFKEPPFGFSLKKKKVLALTDLICCKNQNNLNEVMHYPHLHDFHWRAQGGRKYPSLSPLPIQFLQLIQSIIRITWP